MQDCLEPQALAALLPEKTLSPGMLYASHSDFGHFAIKTRIVNMLKLVMFKR
jgi:hypothetical protein